MMKVDVFHIRRDGKEMVDGLNVDLADILPHDNEERAEVERHLATTGTAMYGGGARPLYRIATRTVPPPALDFPLRVEGSQSDRGRKLAIVDAAGRLIAKTPSNRKSDRLAAEWLCSLANRTAAAR